jgi:hypothetical protein
MGHENVFYLQRMEGIKIWRIDNIFAQYFSELDGAHVRTSQDGLVLSIAEHCLDPREIARMKFADFLKLVVSRKIGIKQEKSLREIWDAVGGSVVSGTR